MSELIPWLRDEDGEYFIVKTEIGEFDFRPDNTAIYRHNQEGHREVDHLFRMVNATSDSTYNGLFVWRKVIEGVVGGTFEELAEEMTDRGFEQIICMELDDGDLDFYIPTLTKDLQELPETLE